MFHHHTHHHERGDRRAFAGGRGRSEFGHPGHEHPGGEHPGRESFSRGPFGRGGPGRPGGRGGPGGLGRFFAHGDLRLVILHLIAEKPRHGYEIIKAVEERVAGAYTPSPGVIYPTLTWLEELGYVTIRPDEGAKKSYEITDAGRAFLDANRPAVDVLLARMAEVGRTHDGGPAPQIVRAMENLRLALRMRISRGPLAEEQVQAVAAALDAAATAVERT